MPTPALGGDSRSSMWGPSWTLPLHVCSWLPPESFAVISRLCESLANGDPQDFSLVSEMRGVLLVRSQWPNNRNILWASSVL